MSELEQAVEADTVSKEDIEEALAISAEHQQGILLEYVGEFVGFVAAQHGLSLNSDGNAISILKNSEGKLQAIIISPVDLHAGEPYARYQVNPDHIQPVRTPKLVIPG